MKLPPEHTRLRQAILNVLATKRPRNWSCPPGHCVTLEFDSFTLWVDGHVAISTSDGIIKFSDLEIAAEATNVAKRLNDEQEERERLHMLERAASIIEKELES